jgi:hypothetical protein
MFLLFSRNSEQCSSRTLSDQSESAAGCLSVIVRHEETARRVAILTLLFLIPVFWLLKPAIIDPDIWWHLRTGQWIVEHGAIPTTDPFSAYGMGKPWVAYSWLFEVLIYALYQAFGLFGIILYQLIGIMAVTLSVYWFISQREPRFTVAAILAACAVVAVCPGFTPRPWLFTILFFTITLHVILRFREGRENKAFWALPLLYVLWANLHIQFIYGLAILGIACLAPVIDHVLDRSYGREDARRLGSSGWWKIFFITTACVLATFVNPQHLHLYRIIIELTGQTGMWQYAQEMQAPRFRSISDWVMLGMALFAVMTLGTKIRVTSFEFLLLVVAVLFSFRSGRDAWFVALTALALHAISAQPRNMSSDPQFLLTKARAGIISGLVIISVGFTLLIRDFSVQHIEAETAKAFPMGAVAVLKERRYEGPMYNHFNWGGYLLWSLPHLAVSMDGRANVHGDERIWRSIRTWNGDRTWASDPELTKARLVLAPRDMALASILRLDPRFELVFEDQIAVVFLAHPQESRPSGPLAHTIP